MDSNIQDLSTIYHLLKKNNLNNTLHKFEQETGLFFDRDYINLLLSHGKIIKVIKYIEGFIIPPTNIKEYIYNDQNNNNINPQQISLKLYHDLHLQRYLEAIFHQEKYEAFQILQSDMSYMLQHSNFDHYKHLVDLLSTNELPSNVIKNFVSSRDTINWIKYANTYFIPHINKLLDSHSTIHNIEIRMKEYTNGIHKNLYIKQDENKESKINSLNIESIDSSDDMDFIEDKQIIKVKKTKKRTKKQKNNENEFIYNKDNYSLITISKQLDCSYNPISRLAISDIGILAVLDTLGRIILFKIRKENLELSQQLHKGFNRVNILPNNLSDITNSIDISQNSKWVCSTSGGSASLYKTDERDSRKSISKSLTKVAFIAFDSDITDAVLFGLFDGKIEIQIKGDSEIRKKLCTSQIIYLAKKSNIIAGIDINGELKISLLSSGTLTNIHNEVLEHWNAEFKRHTVIHFAKIHNQQLILICYVAGLIAYNLEKAVILRCKPSDNDKYMGATVLGDEIIVITDKNYILMYQYEDKQLKCKDKYYLNTLNGIANCIISYDNTHLFIGDNKGSVTIFDTERN